MDSTFGSQESLTEHRELQLLRAAGNSARSRRTGRSRPRPVGREARQRLSEYVGMRADKLASAPLDFRGDR